MKQYYKNRGFTLIELLVVIAIIGILSSVVLASLNSARLKARDAKRVSDLTQITKALDLYYNDNGSYPNTGRVWRSECTGWVVTAPDDVIPGLVPKYLPSFPSDPAMNKPAGQSCYLFASDGTDYALLDYNSPEINYAANRALIDVTRDGGPDGCVLDGTNIGSWKKSSPGALCW